MLTCLYLIKINNDEVDNEKEKKQFIVILQTLHNNKLNVFM